MHEIIRIHNGDIPSLMIGHFSIDKTSVKDVQAGNPRWVKKTRFCEVAKKKRVNALACGPYYEY
jgi:hypothetical protein